jgi:crotonobetainyl-CoA:carnitine CoA-transferase CaiB-like acyl-CoA transferase
MPLPLEGIRVLDLTIWQQGPYASAMLADLGADVVKIEERETGDPGRGAWFVKEVGLSSYFEAHNRGKRSIAIDLKHERGRDVLMRLVEQADVFLNNFRVPAIKRLGLDYEPVSKVNPRIVYVQASGYGPAGPDADLGAFDFLAQARGGFASMNGEPDDPPLPTAVPIADQTGALHACIAVLAGLASVNKTGRGVKFDTSLLGSIVSLQAFDINQHLFTGNLRARNFRGGSRPFWRIYQAGDGKWFCIGMLLDRAWPDVCRVIGKPELVDDPRFDTFIRRLGENAPALIEILDEVFLTAPARTWVEKLNAIGLFAQPIQDFAELAGDPMVLKNGYIHELQRDDGPAVRVAGSGLIADDEPVRVRGVAPHHGEHTEQVLLEAGYSWDEIAQLRHDGVVGPAHRPADSRTT